MVRGRPPKPTQVLELSGAFKKDPKRKRARTNEPQPKGQIGAWPGESKGRTEEQAYNMILETVPANVLADSDQMFVWILAKLVFKIWNGEAKAAEIQMAMAGLGKLGMNPSERSRLQMGPKEKPKNRWSDVG